MKKELTARLHPTLWRTCRVLANRLRLKLMQSLLKRPGQSVAGVAKTVGVPIAVASKYLRDLNARGLLRAERTAANVLYYPEADSSVPQASEILREVRIVFQRRTDPVEFVFRSVTAFTHPRRIQIVASLSTGRKSIADLRVLNSISMPALARHLRKLRDRGLICAGRKGYSLATERSGLDAALIRFAVEE